MEVLVADNGSTDDSCEFLEAHFPTVKILKLDQNHGFAQGNNLAIPHIDTPYFVLLNSDVEVTPGWLEPMVAAIQQDDNIAVVQPKVMAYHQKDHFEDAGAAGGYIDALGYPFCRGRLFFTLEKDEGQYDQPHEIFWASGACCLVRKSVVDQIGLFEPSFFAHMEEIDFCWRAQNLGFRLLYEPKSVIYHMGGGTLEKGSPRKTYLNARNGLAMMYKNLPSSQLFPKIFVRLCLDGVWAARALAQRDLGTIGAIFKAHMHFYGKLGFWRKRRREIYQGKKITTPQHGYYAKSAVWQYFAKGKRKFSEL